MCKCRVWGLGLDWGACFLFVKNAGTVPSASLVDETAKKRRPFSSNLSIPDWFFHFGNPRYPPSLKYTSNHGPT